MWRLLFAALLATLLFASTDQINGLSRFVPANEQLTTSTGLLSAGWQTMLADLGENPAFVPDSPVGDIPVCADVSPVQVEVYREAFGWMRGTDEGRRLYDLLVSEGVCVRTDSLPYNSAYASLRWSPGAGWSETEIVVDRSFVSSLYPDVLAAVLIHEATHVDRAVSQVSCYVVDACTVLANGVAVEEEVAAHSAEAEFWLTAYGRNGKDWSFSRDHNQNLLKSAYLEGPESFFSFVARMRSDSREGEGL